MGDDEICDGEGGCGEVNEEGKGCEDRDSIAKIPADNDDDGVASVITHTHRDLEKNSRKDKDGGNNDVVDLEDGTSTNKPRTKAVFPDAVMVEVPLAVRKVERGEGGNSTRREDGTKEDWV